MIDHNLVLALYRRYGFGIWNPEYELKGDGSRRGR